MAVKYYIRYFDIVGVEHRFNIYDDTYVDEAIQIEGKVILDYSDTDDTLEAIRGQGLSIELEADVNITFSDLWSEQEKTYRVDYYRADQIIFKGWLNPEGFFEDYVGTNWKVTFYCVDGLGFLSDLSFVEDATGFPITGRKKYIEILGLALLRTGLQQPIYTSIDIRYTGLSETLDVLANVYANTERYIKDDGETIMSCEDVIRDILEPFGAVIVSYEGWWHIYKPNQLYNSSTVTFFGYNYQGIPLNPEFYPPTKTIDLSFTLGSDSNGYYPHHCSVNQSIRNESSIGAYRINYKYGPIQLFFNNTTLISYDGVTINDFKVISTTNLVTPFAIGTGGITINCVSSFPGIEQIRSTYGILQGEDTAEITINFSDETRIQRQFQYQIFISNQEQGIPFIGGIIYYLKDDFTWGTSSNVLNTAKVDYGSGVTIKTTTPPKPDAISGDGYIYVSIWTPIRSSGDIILNEVSILKIGSDNVIGEFHTLQRLTKPSAKVKDVVEVATGDNLADIYEGTIYKSDSETPTETWNRKGIVEEKPLLRIMGEETLRLNQLPSRVFSGDVYGYFNYFSIVTINGLDGVFLPIKYSYDTMTNIISATFKQIYGDEIAELDYLGAYKFTLDYGNTVKPTII